MSRPLRVGDRVTATGTVSDFSLSGTIRVDFGRGRRLWLEPSDLTLIEPIEPPVGSVVVQSGKAWVRVTDGWVSTAQGAPITTWALISDGDVIFTPGGEA